MRRMFFFYKYLIERYIQYKGSPQKKTVNFEDIVIKGGWVLVSKPNFFYIRNYEKRQRWMDVKHRCHNFIYS